MNSDRRFKTLIEFNGFLEKIHRDYIRLRMCPMNGLGRLLYITKAEGLR